LIRRGFSAAIATPPGNAPGRSATAVAESVTMNRQQRRAATRQGGNPVAPTAAGVLPASARRLHELLATGVAHHQAGRLPQAEACYRQVLAERPTEPEALHLLGMLAHQAGRRDVALDLIGQAIQQNQRNHFYFNNRGIVLRELGRLEEALAGFDRAIALRPDYAEAHSNRGITLLELNRPEQALVSLGRATRLKPDLAEAHSSRGNALVELRRMDEAIASLDRAIALKPSLAEAHSNRGRALAELGRHEEALASYDRAIALRPDVAEVHYNRGIALAALDRADAAVRAYNRALALRPDHAAAWSNRGIALCRLDRLEEALASCEHAAALQPELAEAHTNRGLVLGEMRRYDDALAVVDSELARDPDNAEAYANRAAVMTSLRRPEEALAAADRAIALKPAHAEAHSNRAALMVSLQRPEDARQAAERAIALRPHLADAHCNQGMALQALRRLPEAIAAFDRAIALRPDFATALNNKALALLLTGQFAEGWKLQESRWQTKQFLPMLRGFDQPVWRGEPLDGRVLLLHAEQGLGDTIQFCRYAPLVAQRGSVLLEVQPPLLPLLAAQPDMPRLIARGERLPEFDLHCPLLSLPLAFGAEPSTFPVPGGYLAADPARIAEWAPRLPPANGPRVGIVWSGNPMHLNDANRSLPLAGLLSLLDCGATLLSLQSEVRASDRAVFDDTPRLARLGVPFSDFADTAAVIAQLDLVIAVDTSVAHVAAALGKPTWILLPHVPDWRWLLDRDDSPWYASVRLFRQSARGDWPGVIERVRQALLAFAGSTP
jgi:tetratricopeptide (TPR) repeat protein